MLYYKALKMKELLLLFTANWKNLINMMLNGRSQTRKTIYGIIPFNVFFVCLLFFF